MASDRKGIGRLAASKRMGQAAAAADGNALGRARDLAWTGRHAQAIEVATAALDATGGDDRSRFELLQAAEQSGAVAAVAVDLALRLERSLRAGEEVLGGLVELLAQRG